jgi:hypothetical protein
VILVDAAFPVFVTVGAVIRLRVRLAGFPRVPVFARIFPRRLRRFRAQRDGHPKSQNAGDDNRDDRG